MLTEGRIMQIPICFQEDLMWKEAWQAHGSMLMSEWLCKNLTWAGLRSYILKPLVGLSSDHIGIERGGFDGSSRQSLEIISKNGSGCGSVTAERCFKERYSTIS